MSNLFQWIYTGYPDQVVVDSFTYCSIGAVASGPMALTLAYVIGHRSGLGQRAGVVLGASVAVAGGLASMAHARTPVGVMVRTIIACFSAGTALAMGPEAVAWMASS